MRKKYFRNECLLFVVVMISISAFAQKKAAIWTPTSTKQIDVNEVQFYKQIPQKSTFFNVDVAELSKMLIHAPKSESYDKTSNVIVNIPNATGAFESFRISEVTIMEPVLAAKFPEIKTYVGVGIENPAAQLRLTITPQKGLSGMVLSEKKTIFIEPYSKDLKTYIAFINSEGDINTDAFLCETESIMEKSGISNQEYMALRNADDGQLRTYRLALACTVEYALYHGGTLGSVMAAMTNTMNRVNGVYVRDLGLTMTMVDNTSIINLGPNVNSDNYTNNNGSAMLGQNQTECDTNIGSANYDIGHVFSTGGGGVAYLNSPCTGIKAGGVTGSGAPTGDAFDIDYVAHEMGHQFGGNHTQNNSCNRSSVSVEPGSASSIMGYAGICAPNVQNNSDDYFHGENIKEMWININTGASSSCGTVVSSGNTAPTAAAGTDYAIPPSTAFKLTGVGSDSDGDTLTYCWEQNDTTPAPMPPESTNTGGPTFRSLDPKTVPVRYFPEFNTVLSGSLASTWEVVPSVARTMGFLFTVRDNAAIAGNTQSDEMTVTVENVTPFTVATPPTWAPSSSQTVTWVVGQSNNATINCQSVNILFSSDGGANFDTTLASGVPNTGSAAITVPNIPANNNSRILVEAADNVFYAITDVFSLSNDSDFSISNTTGGQSACNLDAVSYDFNYVTSNGFSETTTFSATITPALPGATIAFTPETLNADGTFTMDVSSLIGETPGEYTITVTATAPSVVKTATAMLTVADGVCATAATNADDDRITRVLFNTINNVTLAASADDAYQDFTSISTDIERESTHEITVHVNTNGAYFYVNKVWIDWNQNCSFNDEGEEYDLGTANNVVDVATSNSPLSITVPADAALGTTRMRVGMKNTDNVNNDFGPCETGFWGQIEDYTVNVLSSLSVNDFEANTFLVYPNPTQGTLHIKLNNTDDLNISIFDVRGRRVYNEFNNNKTEIRTLDVNALSSGIYLLNIESNGSRVTKKIIIE
jgi:hypothetical protein